MKTFVIVLAVLAASFPLASLAEASSPVPPPCPVLLCRPICLECLIDSCTTGEVVVCASYDSTTECANVAVGYRSTSGAITASTPAESYTTPAENVGPVHVSSMTVAVDGETVYQPYNVAGRVVTDQLCTGSASGLLGSLLA